MFKRTLLIAISAAGFGMAGAAYAGVDLESAGTCISDAMGSGTSPVSCIETAQIDCSTIPEDTPAVAQLCYSEAKDAWSEGIAASMQALKDSAPADALSISQIEAKYDILAGFLQCDRMEELSLAVSDISSDKIATQKAHCAATASGLAYARLLWRVQSLQ